MKRVKGWGVFAVVFLMAFFSGWAWAQEGEGEGEACSGETHAADSNSNGKIELNELLRLIQFYNSGGYHCATETTEDGYEPGSGDASCCPHTGDYDPEFTASWTITLKELLRIIQFYNTGGFYRCESEGTEDGFCPGILPVPPNVVLMIFCTLRFDRVEGSRSDTPIMPFLASFAAQGAHFTKAISAASWTRPGVNSLHTGIYPEVFNGDDETPPQQRYVVSEEDVTIVEWLASHGYDAWGYQTNGNANAQFGFVQGYPEGQFTFHEFPPADVVTDEVLATLPQWKPPFFSLVQYIEAHEPYTPPVSYETFFGPTPQTTVADNINLSINFRNFYIDLFESWRDNRAPTYTPLTANGVEMVRYRYDASVRAQDDEVARLVNAIEAEHPNTIYIMVADHGEDLLNRDILGHGTTLHQEQINVPLAMKGPGVPVGVVDRYVQTLDVLPTLARIAGLPPLEGWQGADLFDTTPRPVFSTTRNGTGATLISAEAVIDGDMKYILSNKEPGPELYNLATDPGELNNLAASNPQEVARLQGLLADHRDAVLP